MTLKHPRKDNQRVETRRNLIPREYEALVAQCDESRVTVYKKRRYYTYCSLRLTHCC